MGASSTSQDASRASSPTIHICHAQATRITMAMIMGWVIRLGDTTQPVRAFLYDYCEDREAFTAAEARGPDINYGAWFTSQVEARANMVHSREELVWWDHYDSQIRHLDNEGFVLAVNEAIALGQRNIPFLIRPRGSYAGKNELCSSAFTPNTHICVCSLVIGQARSERMHGAFPYVGSTQRTIAQPASSPSAKPPMPPGGHLSGLTNNNNIGGTKCPLPTKAPMTQILSGHYASRTPQDSTTVMSQRSYVSRSKTPIPRKLVSPRPTRYHMRTASLLAVGDVRPSKRNRVDQDGPPNVLKVNREVLTSPPALDKGQVARRCATICRGNGAAWTSPPKALTMDCGIGEGKMVDFGAFVPRDTSDPTLLTTLSRLLPDMGRSLQCEHMTRQLYDDACALWRHDPSLKAKDQLWKVPGVNRGVLPYQAVGVTWALLRISQVNGVFICDETGLGKTLELFLIFIFTIHINKCVVSYDRFRSGRDTTRKHLRPNEVGIQGRRAICPSQQYWSVPCPCANEITRKISLSLGPSLILVHDAAQLTQFRYEWEKWIDVKATCFDFPPELYILHGMHTERDIPGHILSRLRAQYLNGRSPGTYPSAASSHYIICTTARCYEPHVARAFRCDIDTGGPEKYKKVVPGIRWSTVHQDEAHKSYNTNTLNITILRDLRKWGAPRIVCWTATPWEATLKSVTNYVSCFWNEEWERDSQLREFGPSNLAQLERWYQYVACSRPREDSRNRIEIRQALMDKWGLFCKHFMLRRKSNTIWIWDNVPIMAKPHHYHKDVSLEMEPRDIIDAVYLHKDLVRGSGSDHAKGNGESLRFSVTSAMVGRLHANFPRVLKYHSRNNSTNGFRFTSKEITDNDWHQRLFHRENSPYNGGIAIDILSQSPKLNWLKHTFVPKVLRSRWFYNGQTSRGREYPAKAVILSNIPATARLLYEWFQLESIPCCYIAAYMSHENRRQIIDAFQDEKDGGNACFLISTASLIGTGTNLSRASYMVLIEPCWTAGDELQAFGRINRVSSTGTTQSYRLYIPGHEVEDRIRLRQQARGVVYKDTLEGPGARLQ
ncbi:hypothetical protein G7Y89_g7860 [Cudoniella acicularis]|uniref:Helicase C-terminal domain-containing protein n=1 Tax=Cudoniella acicularis TaxID=354080 RepID=A0A8H4W153_9HELO|nr:hypothetical protein G7Y89_g7860 [Cudoniella acicularis]